MTSAQFTSDLTLGTLVDAIDDAEQHWTEETHRTESLPPVRLARFGVGEITSRDVLVARAGSGIIVSYGVSVARDAATQLKAQRVRLLSFDKLQDAVDALVQREVPISELRTNLRPRVKNNMRE